ncbi:Enhancing lycopene biosynthesis protein 2 [Trichlorobacter thiogenes]|uniref:Enhancing lycopene biosynthesis protein 2 n=1 Tax=Trichlorobacter thiogenes TaxID=115783 RepID=A0A1T4ML96_9BACT|nr:isoprenoid biosynthesis glyoxalase ElbB [Trichlorobacter thiogenes]SJZ67651.1 Enhancing lycopene biosynthesis protein 2 [Trichlorobacter thiogenes]
MKKIGVVLSGCGFRDGSEIHEAVCALLAIDQAGAEAICMAPDIELHEMNHCSMELTGAKRKVLVESARIARGKIKNIAEIKAADLDALVFPGGFGAALNLCDFGQKGAAASVNPEVARLTREIHAVGKPIGAICIAPALIAAILGKEAHPTLTIGTDPGTAAEVEKTGARHQDCPANDIVIDQANKIVSTPAYMLAGRISEVYEGIGKCIKVVVEMA